MQDKNLIKDLPIEILSHISSFLDHKSLVTASMGDKAFYGLFNMPNVWKYRLIKDFDLDAKLLATTFQNEINNHTLNYKQLYVHFHYLNQQRNLPKFIKSISRDITQQHLVLLACADNVTKLNNMPREQQYTIAVLAIYAGCLTIPYSFMKNHLDKTISANFLIHAAASCNFQLAQYLLNPDNNFGLKPDDFTLGCAAVSGNLQLVEYLLTAENNFNLSFNQSTLNLAAQSGNLLLMQYLLDLYFLLKPDNLTLGRAAESGNLQLVQYLLNPKNKFWLTPDNFTLKCASVSGNSKLVQYLLNAENEFGLTPDKDALNFVAKSGNLQLVQYLLNPKNKFWLTPDKETLNGAAQSGNLQLMHYLLSSENKFGLKPDNHLLNNAAQSGNLQLMQYLLNPNNNFGLIPDGCTLTSAAEYGHLRLVQYLLNPDNQFDLEVTQKILNTAAEIHNLALSEYLLPSHLGLQKALKKLQDHDIIAANILLQESYTACPSHHEMMLQYILNNPQRFNLTESAMHCLKEHTDALYEDKKMNSDMSLNF